MYVPNDPYHLLAFWAQLEALGSALQWENDIDHTALPVSAVWRDVYQQARTQFYEGGCMTDPCCPETNDKLDAVNVNLEAILTLLKGGATITFNADSAASDFAVDCTPDEFSGNEGETPVEKIKRQNALCLAVNRWLVSVLGNLAEKMNKLSLLPEIWALGGFTAPPSMYARINYVEGTYTVAYLNSIIDSEDAFQKFACLLIQELANEGNTFAIFKKLVHDANLVAITDPDPAMPVIGYIAEQYAKSRVNYTLFSKELERSYDDINDGDDYACLCFGGICDVAEFELIGLEGTEVTRIDDDHWQVVQTNYTDAPPDKRSFKAVVRDAYWRCFNLLEPSAGWAGYDNYNCAGAHITGIGGGTGQAVQVGMIVQEYDVDPVVGINVVFRIACP